MDPRIYVLLYEAIFLRLRDAALTTGDPRSTHAPLDPGRDPWPQLSAQRRLKPTYHRRGIRVTVQTILRPSIWMPAAHRRDPVKWGISTQPRLEEFEVAIRAVLPHVILLLDASPAMLPPGLDHVDFESFYDP
jgi:hypothetical protein